MRVHRPADSLLAARARPQAGGDLSTEAMERDAEPLVEELLSLAPEKLELAVHSVAKFRTFGVGSGLASRAAALQGVEAKRCAALASAASACLSVLPLSPAQQAEGERIRALEANAHRLLGEPGRFFMALTFKDIQPQAESGEYLRALALVHWERARTPEAVALLARAERVFRAEGYPGEAVTTRRLRMLLHAERGEEGEALRLYASSGPADAGGPSWLTARAALTAAFCSAALPTEEDRATARRALAEGHDLARQVQEETEKLYLLWLTARAAARLTDDQLAGETLSDLQRHFLASLPWAEVIPLTLDLFACRTPAGQGLDLSAVEEDLRRTAPSAQHVSYAEHALSVTRCFAPERTPWETAGVAGHVARNLFRRRGENPPRPIPFHVSWPGAEGGPLPVA